MASYVSIQRYATTLELLMPAFILATFMNVLGSPGRKLFIACGVVLVATTVYPDWGRVGFNAPFYQISDEGLKQKLAGSVVILGPPPLAFLVPSVDGPGSIWVKNTFTEADQLAAKEKLRRRAEAPRYLILHRSSQTWHDARAALSQYGLYPSTDFVAFSTVAGDSLLCVKASANGNSEGGALRKELGLVFNQNTINP
ncbi:MAG: hypothetical protein V1792_00400 [Pseudomonadota bacterium]